MLETSRADAHKSGVSMQRAANTPTTSTPCVSLHRPRAPGTRSSQMAFTPAPGNHGPWVQQRKTQSRPRVTTSPPPVFDISSRNRFAPLCETDRDAVVIGDSIVRHVRATLAEGKVHTHCLPGTRVLDVSVQIPAILKDDESVAAVVIHAGANDTKLRQTDTLKMLPLSQIMRKNQIAYHSYADDTQIYLALSPNDYSPIDSLCQCIDEINSWMCQNFLQLNKEKTEVIAFGNKDEVLKVNAYLDSRGQTTKNQVRNLGVILETDLSFSSHVKAVTKSAYYHLKNIARIRCFVSSQDLEKLVHAFITSRVDYCNGLLTGLPKKTIRQLQLIQNAAARILTRTRKSEHITPVLRSLHWLPVTFRIDFKVLLLVYKSLNGIGPKYMADMLTEYKPNRPLRSLGSSQLEIPRVHTKQGESAFSYYAARSWNQLPEEIKCAKTLATFKSGLKTHLFSCAFVE